MLRRFQVGQSVDSAAVIALSERYGALDGMVAYWYTTRFTTAARALTTAQQAQVLALASQLSYTAPKGGFLYSQPIAMPTIANTNGFFR